MTAPTITAIDVPGEPTGVAFAAGAVWAASADHVSRIDPETNEVTATIDLPLKAKPPGPEEPPFNRIDANDEGVWVAIGGHDDIPVVRIDPETNKVVATVTVERAGGIPRIAVGETGVWMTALGAGTLTRIDPETNEIAATIPSRGREELLAPSGVAEAFGSVWVEEHHRNTLTRIDPETNEIEERIVTTAAGEITADDDAVWVIGAGTSTVDRVDPETNEVVATIADCSTTQAVVAGGDAVWISQPQGVCRIAPATNTGTHTTLPNGTWFLAYGDDAVWVSVPDSNQVLRVDVGP